jgi:uncharacterized protein (DUF1697 family)
VIEPARTYICLLRGINVSGRKVIRMADLRKLFESIGFGRVETYLQSGNVVFDVACGGESLMARRIKDEIERSFGCDVPVVVREKDRFLRVLEQNPLRGLDGIDDAKLRVTFLSCPPAATNLERLESFDAAPERFAVRGDCVYLYCPNGYGRTKLSNNFLERKLGMVATTHNWKTVNALHRILCAR